MSEPRLPSPSDNPDIGILIIAHVGFCRLLLEQLIAAGALRSAAAQKLLRAHAAEIRQAGSIFPNLAGSADGLANGVEVAADIISAGPKR